MARRAVYFLIAAGWCWFSCAVPSRADVSFIGRETFQGVGTLTAASPGTLGAVSGGSF